MDLKLRRYSDRLLSQIVDGSRRTLPYSFAMKLRDIIKAPKDVRDWGKWQPGGRMPRTAFPLSKSRGRAYRLGAYRWRVIQFAALSARFRILVAYNADKEQYRAVLGLEQAGGLSVLAQYEYHGTHPGWHVLASCGDAAITPAGVMRWPGQVRLPEARAVHSNVAFDIADDNQALDKAARLFGLHRKQGGLV